MRRPLHLYGATRRGAGVAVDAARQIARANRLHATGRDIEAIQIFARRIRESAIPGSVDADGGTGAPQRHSVRYVYGCICAGCSTLQGLRGPCVLLATIESKECDFTYICNLDARCADRNASPTGCRCRSWRAPRQGVLRAPSQAVSGVSPWGTSKRFLDGDINKVIRSKPGAVYEVQPTPGCSSRSTASSRRRASRRTHRPGEAAIGNVSALRTIALPCCPLPGSLRRDLAARRGRRRTCVVADVVGRWRRT